MIAALCSAPSARQEAFGAQLFADPRLSVDGTVACASCHVPERGFVDNLPTPLGIHGRRGVRNAPTVLNAFLQSPLFWDGRAPTLEAQALGPLLDRSEMGQPNAAAVVAAVRAIPVYAEAMDDLFGSNWGAAEVGKVLAAYERTLVARDAPLDHFLSGDDSALSATAQAGWKLFNGKARCNLCHAVQPSTQLLTDQDFHNIGIGLAGEGYVPLQQRGADLGRFLVTKQSQDRGAFRTPDLHNVGITAPYMHDGSLATLWDVMDHYNRGGDINPRLDGKMRALNLTEEEIDAMVAVMFAMTDGRYQAANQVSQLSQTAQKNVRPERDQ